MANFKCTKCSSSFEDEINGVIYCPYCMQIQPLPLNLDDTQKENIYTQAIAIFERARDVSNIEDVMGVFVQLDAYKGSRQYVEKCQKRIEELQNDVIYAEALQKMENETVRSYKKAIELFSKIPNWKNASFKLDEAKLKLGVLLERNEKRKDKAMKITMIVSGALIFALILTYLIIELLVPSVRYSRALRLVEKEKYDEAYEILEDLGDYKDAPTELKRSKYNRATAYLSNDDKLNACKYFGQAVGYSDAEDKVLELCKSLSISEQLSVLEVGNSVVFGVYEQNTDIEGVEHLEWIIAEKSTDKVILVSKYAIDAQPFSDENTLWSKSELREWLNDSFINKSFSSRAQARILSQTTITTYKDAQGVEQMDVSEDKAFILSKAEAEKYFPTDDEKLAPATKYLPLTEAHINEGNGCAHYWLRTPSQSGDTMYINGSGTINEDGKEASRVMAVRPVICVNPN